MVKHSKAFIKKRNKKIRSDWGKYNRWANKQDDIEVRIPDFKKYKENWLSMKEDGIKNVLDRQKYESRYKTDYKAALSFKHRAKEDLDIDISLEEAKKTGTRDLATKIYDELKAANPNSTTKQLSVEISHYFGS